MRLGLMAFIMWCSLLFYVNKRFSKQNDGFYLRNISGSTDQAGVFIHEMAYEDIETIFSQPFYYLTKGHQSYVFLSQDNHYVLKFYRFPSHLRPWPWLNHVFSNFFSKKRQKIKRYNENKLIDSFSSFALAAKELRQETGILITHTSKTDTLQRQVTLIDRLKHHYQINLDSHVFILQKRADLIYPLLKKALYQKNNGLVEDVLTSLQHLISTMHQKGITNRDAIVEKNLGWIDQKVVFIDVGSFEKKSLNSLERDEQFIKITSPLFDWLKIQGYQ